MTVVVVVVVVVVGASVVVVGSSVVVVGSSVVVVGSSVVVVGSSVVVVGASVVVVTTVVVVGLGTAQLCDLSVVVTGVPVARRRSHVKSSVPMLTKTPLHSAFSVQLEMHAHTNASRSPPHDACDDEVMLIWFAAIRALL
jgi:hypothetical protein